MFPMFAVMTRSATSKRSNRSEPTRVRARRIRQQARRRQARKRASSRSLCARYSRVGQRKCRRADGGLSMQSGHRSLSWLAAYGKTDGPKCLSDCLAKARVRAGPQSGGTPIGIGPDDLVRIDLQHHRVRCVPELACCGASVAKRWTIGAKDTSELSCLLEAHLQMLTVTPRQSYLPIAPHDNIEVWASASTDCVARALDYGDRTQPLGAGRSAADET